MENQKLTTEDKNRIIGLLKSESYPEPTNIRFDAEGIISYEANCSRRDAMLGFYDVLDGQLDVNYDGDPTTIEVGVRGDGEAAPVEVVVMVKPEIWVEQ